MQPGAAGVGGKNGDRQDGVGGGGAGEGIPALEADEGPLRSRCAGTHQRGPADPGLPCSTPALSCPRGSSMVESKSHPSQGRRSLTLVETGHSRDSIDQGPTFLPGTADKS